MKNIYTGYLCGVLSAVFYGLNPFFGIPLYWENMTVPNVLFYRFLIATALMGAVMLVGKTSFRLPKKMLPAMIAEGGLLGLTCLFWFFSFSRMSSGLAATILYTFPAMIAAILAIGFREKISFRSGAGILLSFCGVAIICGGGNAVSFAGIVYALLSALTYAVYIVVVRKSALKKLSSATLTFYAMLFGDLVFFLMTGCGVSLQKIPSLAAAGNLFGLALFTSLLSFLLLAVAIKKIGETRTAILGALEPLTAVVVGIVCFHEAFSVYLFCGVVLILGAVTLVVVQRGQKSASGTSV